MGETSESGGPHGRERKASGRLSESESVKVEMLVWRSWWLVVKDVCLNRADTLRGRLRRLAGDAVQRR